MKASAALILCLALALPVPVAAQSTEPAETTLIETNWSLKTPRRKAKPPQTAQTAQPAAAQVQGPAVPPPPRIKAPRGRTAARTAAPQRPKRVNGAPLAAAIARKEGRE